MTKKHRKGFRCTECGYGRFKKFYTFNIDFRNVNFTDEIIYDIVNEEYYQCTECDAVYTKKEIEKILKSIIIKYKEDYWEERNR